MVKFRVHAVVNGQPKTVDATASNPNQARQQVMQTLKTNDKTVVRIKKIKVLR